MQENLGPSAGPMDPIIQELQADYRSVVDLLHGITVRASRQCWELSHSRPNVGNLQKDASDIIRICESIRRILQIPEAS